MPKVLLKSYQGLPAKIISLCLLVSCARAGEKIPPPPEAASSDAVFEGDEDVGFEKPSAPLQLIPSELIQKADFNLICGSSQTLSEPMELKPSITIDGQLSLFEQDFLVQRQQLGAAPDNVSEHYLKLGRDGLYLATNQTGTIFFEITGEQLIFTDEAQLERLPLRPLRWDNQGLSVKIGGDWVYLDRSLWNVAVGENHREFWVDRLAIEDWVGSPFWVVSLQAEVTGYPKTIWGSVAGLGRYAVRDKLSQHNLCGFQIENRRMLALELWPNDDSESASVDINREKILRSYRSAAFETFDRLSFLSTGDFSRSLVFFGEQKLNPGERELPFFKSELASLRLPQEWLLQFDETPFIEQRIYARSLRFYLNRMLSAHSLTRNSPWKGPLRTILMSSLLRENLGTGFWLLETMTQPLLGQLDPDLTLPVYKLLSSETSSAQLIIWLEDCLNQGVEITPFDQCLGQRFSESVLAEIVSPEGLPQNLEADYVRELFTDLDGDGLPFYLESLSNASDESFDSDTDGWSDLSEKILMTDPNNNLSKPGQLVLDGIITDWIDLIPNRLLRDELETIKACPKVDIETYAAFISSDWLLVGAQLATTESKEKLLWEVSLDLRSDEETFAVEATTGSNTLSISRNDRRIAFVREFKTAQRDLEFLLPTKLINELLSSEASPLPGDGFTLRQLVDLKFKISVFKSVDNGPDQFCDDTPWSSAGAAGVLN